MDARLKSILYILACVVLPALWGLVIVWVTNTIERRVRRKDDLPPIEYHI